MVSMRAVGSFKSIERVPCYLNLGNFHSASNLYRPDHSKAMNFCTKSFVLCMLPTEKIQVVATSA